MDRPRYSRTDRPIAAQDRPHGHWLDDRKRGGGRLRAALGLHVPREMFEWCFHGSNVAHVSRRCNGL